MLLGGADLSRIYVLVYRAMSSTSIEPEATLWLVNDTPTRMLYAGKRWRVTDTPTRLREAVWALPLEGPRSMYGWRFQASDEQDTSVVFDVYQEDHGWHVHRAYT